MKTKKVIVAPLNWGLGHATRCIPIINALLDNNFTPVLALDGNALALLKKEFPKLELIELPSYHIRYRKNLKWSLLWQIPRILTAVRQERTIVKNYINQQSNVVGIISDNRFGVRDNKIPSVYLTHQINVLSGWSTFLTSKIHQNIIKKFDECWIPDDKKRTLSGKLSKSKFKTFSVKYLGALSRFKPLKLPEINDILIILSGPEPNRTHLEKKLIEEFKNYNGKIVLIRGKVLDDQKQSYIKNIKMYNYLLSNDLEREINQSKLIICRSGYSSIIDMAKLGKKVFFIPTRNQNEQEYLAKHIENQNIAPFSVENKFKTKLLEKIQNYKGFETSNPKFNGELFDLFESK